jgi:hypothetical protein
VRTRVRARSETSSLTQVKGPVSCVGSLVDECRMGAAGSLYSRNWSLKQENATRLPLSTRTIKRNSLGTKKAHLHRCHQRTQSRHPPDTVAQFRNVPGNLLVVGHVPHVDCRVASLAYISTLSPRCIPPARPRPTDAMRCFSFSPLHGAKFLGSRSSSNTANRQFLVSRAALCGTPFTNS